jgi:hypothetical protein
MIAAPVVPLREIHELPANPRRTRQASQFTQLIGHFPVMIAVGKRGPCFGIFQLRLCIFDAICGPERTRFIAERPAERILLVATLCRAAPGALQSCNEPIGSKKTQVRKFHPEFGSQTLQ